MAKLVRWLQPAMGAPHRKVGDKQSRIGGHHNKKHLVEEKWWAFNNKVKASNLVLEEARNGLIEAIKEVVRWSAPDFGKVKMNWNALVSASTKRMGIDIIIRENMSEVLAYLSSSWAFSPQPIIVECWALLRVMKFCLELDFYQVELKGDVQVVI